MKDREFLIWLLNRLVHQYGESPNVDFVGKLASIIHEMPAEQLTPNIFDAHQFLEEKVS
jgi:hypothetical protein